MSADSTAPSPPSVRADVLAALRRCREFVAGEAFGVPIEANEQYRTAVVDAVLAAVQPWIDHAHADGVLSATPASVGVCLIDTERQRQIAQEGWTIEHDASHHDGDELVLAAISYATPAHLRPSTGMAPSRWPWGTRYWKPTPDDRQRELVKAGALIAAELDRLGGDA